MDILKEKPKEKYKFKVDNRMYESSEMTLSGRQILIVSEHTPPERFRLDMQQKKGSTSKVALEDIVDLTDPSLEKFLTIPLGPQEG